MRDFSRRTYQSAYAAKPLGRCLLGAAIALALQSCGASNSSSLPKEAWNPINDPDRLDVATRVFDEIPAQATLGNGSLWSGYYWPTYRGGISYRWQYRNPGGSDHRHYLYSFPSAIDMRRLAPQQLAGLSPAEKLDVLMGRLDLPLAKRERQKMLGSVQANGQIPTWYGSCHGWAAASIMEAKPRYPVQARAVDGRVLQFRVEDVEALATGLYADLNAFGSIMLGRRCREAQIGTDANGRVISEECRDTNPGAFHLVVTDFIGRQRKSFVADISQGSEVWNHPVSSYRYQAGSIRQLTTTDRQRGVHAADAVYLVEVQMLLGHAGGVGAPRGGSGDAFGSSSFRYVLELDSARRIVGGEWLSAARPDFLWAPVSRPTTSAGGLIRYDVVKWLIDYSSTGRAPGPQPAMGGNAPDDDPDVVNDQPAGVVTDGTPLAEGVLRVVNASSAERLIREVRLSEVSSYRLRVHFLGNDGVAPSPDDRPFRSVAQLRQLISESEIGLLAEFAVSRGYVRR